MKEQEQNLAITLIIIVAFGFVMTAMFAIAMALMGWWAFMF